MYSPNLKQRFNTKIPLLTISRYPLATRITLMSEKDLRMSSRVVVVKDRTFWVEFSATLCSTAWTETQRMDAKLIVTYKMEKYLCNLCCQWLMQIFNEHDSWWLTYNENITILYLKNHTLSLNSLLTVATEKFCWNSMNIDLMNIHTQKCLKMNMFSYLKALHTLCIIFNKCNNIIIIISTTVWNCKKWQEWTKKHTTHTDLWTLADIRFIC